MEEFKQILRDAIEVLRKPETEILPEYLILNKAYNKALNDVIEQVIKRIPD